MASSAKAKSQAAGLESSKPQAANISSPLQYFSDSSIGRKLVMAATGGLLILFLVAHVVGNLQMFAGQEKINAYGAMLREMPAVLWPARAGLLAIFAVHVLMAFQLRSLNSKAKPQKYESPATVQASAASLYMLETGLVVLFFVVMHLLHFTLGTLQPENFHLLDAKGRHDIYSIVILGFQNRAYALAYVLCMIGLGVHLSHAIASMFQTLGWYSTYATPIVRKASRLVAGALVLAYISIPVAVQLGVITLPSAESSELKKEH